MSDSEQPHPDIVQKTKDIFESLARKHRQEAALQRTQSSVQSNSKPTTFKSNLPRSQSMLVLTGRAWCSGSSLLNSIYHRNGACSSLSRGTKNATLFNNSFINENQNHQETKPHFQRSCSELDKYFQDGIDDEDLWETYAGSDRGSPVSPEVIQKIRQQGSCVKFFGREASIVNGDDDNDSINDKNAYILDYPIEIQRDNGSLSPLSVDDSESSQKPKIIGVMSKLSPGGSTASSGSSTWRRGETPSPASPSLNGWLLGDASFDDLQSCFNMEGMDGSRSRSTSAVESSYVKLALRHSNAQYSDSVTMPRCHGKWMKNPYWPGSYYVVYDFTQQQNHASAQDK